MRDKCVPHETVGLACMHTFQFGMYLLHSGQCVLFTGKLGATEWADGAVDKGEIHTGAHCARPCGADRMQDSKAVWWS